MQICIHWKDNSSKTVNPKSDLTTSEDSQPMISYILVSHCKPLGPIISTFNFGYPHLPLKEGPRSSLIMRRFLACDFL